MAPASDEGPEVYVHKTGLEVDERRTRSGLLELEKQAHLPPGRKGDNRNPFGLGAVAFGALVALVTLIIVGASLGGGLGSALANTKSKAFAVTTVTQTITATASATVSPTASTETTTGIYANVTVPEARQVYSLFNNCSALEGTGHIVNYTPNTFDNPQKFNFVCGYAYVGHSQTDDSEGEIETLAGLIAYTPTDCAVACTTYNLWNNDKVCRAITFATDLSDSIDHNGANCWLFTTTGGRSASSVSLIAYI